MDKPILSDDVLRTTLNIIDAYDFQVLKASALEKERRRHARKRPLRYKPSLLTHRPS